jgi:hypothetical protein
VLRAPEQDEAGCEGAPPGASQAKTRDADKEVAGEEELERVGQGENQRADDEGVGEPIVIECAPKFAVQKMVNGAGGAAKDAGQAGDRPARGREGKPMRERAGRDERKQKGRDGQEREMKGAPELFGPGKSGREARIHQAGGRVSCTGGTDGGGGGSVGLTPAQTS